MNVINLNKDIYVAVTCDTEFLPPWNEGSWEQMSTWTFEQGIPIFCDILDRYGIKGTFFTQAKAAELFPETIRSLADEGHLVGSHSYNHENYGGKVVKVYTPSQPIFLKTKVEKQRLLLKANEILEKVIGYRPLAFVAPFDNINDELLLLIDELGFEVDCSFHNYSLKLNSFPFYPIKRGNIVEIPLTVLPIEPHGNKNVLEAFTYDFMAAKTKLEEYIRESESIKPFTVILLTSHPYEFVDVKVPHPREVLIVGDEKIKTLDSVISIFQEMGAKFITPLEIAHNFKRCNTERCLN